MRGREAGVAGDSNTNRVRENSKRSKDCGKDTHEDLRMDFFSGAIFCTGSITTKLLIMHDYPLHLLSPLSGEAFVTRLLNDPGWNLKIKISSLEKKNISLHEIKDLKTLN